MDAHERAAVERRIEELESILDGLPRPLGPDRLVESIELQDEMGRLLRALNGPTIVKRTRRSARSMRPA